jgi:enoyl-CoA hydratase/carnithine racemase
VTELVHFESGAAVDRIVLDSPHNRNALSIRFLEELLDGIGRSAGRVLVLEHTGTVFCAGVDMRERQEVEDAAARHTSLLAQALTELWAHPRPVVCRIAGAVRGGGMGLVAASDLVVATPDSTFGYSEVRVGVAPAMVAAVALQKVPLGQLLPHLLDGEPFDAERARQLGLVAAVADDAGPTVASLLRGGPNAVETTKRVAREFAGASVADLLREAETLSATLFASPEAQEGMAAFTGRRAPRWANPA